MINILFSKKIGADEFGNQYFINNKNKRFVKYKGLAEPSKIPAEWHGWIHYNQDDPPVINTQNKKLDPSYDLFTRQYQVIIK